MSLEQARAGLEETVALPNGRPMLRCVCELVDELRAGGRRVYVHEDEVVTEPRVHSDMEHILTSNVLDVIELLTCDLRVH